MLCQVTRSPKSLRTFAAQPGLCAPAPGVSARGSGLPVPCLAVDLPLSLEEVALINIRLGVLDGVMAVVEGRKPPRLERSQGFGQAT